MNEVCEIKPFMISITLGIGLIRHPWCTRVILLASKGQFTWVRTVRMGPSGATIATVMYLTSLRSQQFSNVLQALYAAAELWEENRPWAQVHFCFTDYGPGIALCLDSSSLLSGSGSARNTGFSSHFFSFFFFPFLPFSFPFFLFPFISFLSFSFLFTIIFYFLFFLFFFSLPVFSFSLSLSPSLPFSLVFFFSPFQFFLFLFFSFSFLLPSSPPSLLVLLAFKYLLSVPSLE